MRKGRCDGRRSRRAPARGTYGHRTQDLARQLQLAADGLQLRVEIGGATRCGRSGFQEFGEAEIEQLDLALAELGGDSEVRESRADQVGGLYCIVAVGQWGRRA